MRDLIQDQPPRTGRRSPVGLIYVLLPLVTALGLIAPVLATTTSPVGVHPSGSLALVSVYLICFALPASAAAPRVSRLLPRAAIRILAAISSLTCAIWMLFLGWTLTLGASGGRIPLLDSPDGLAAVLLTASVSMWATSLAALAALLPQPLVRAIALAALGAIGLGVLVSMIIVAS